MVDYQERSAGRYWSETLERVEGCAHSKPAAMSLCRTHVYQGCSGVEFLSLLTCKVKEPICDRGRAAGSAVQWRPFLYSTLGPSPNLSSKGERQEGMAGWMGNSGPRDSASSKASTFETPLRIVRKDSARTGFSTCTHSGSCKRCTYRCVIS
jgi:hypothetical protein